MLLNTSTLQAIQMVDRTCTGGEGVVGSSLTWPSPDRIFAVEDCLSGTLGRWCRALNSGLEHRLLGPEAGSMGELNGGRR